MQLLDSGRGDARLLGLLTPLVRTWHAPSSRYDTNWSFWAAETLFELALDIDVDDDDFSMLFRDEDPIL